MEEAMFVHVCQAKHRLEHNALDLLLWELRSAVFHKLINILLHVLEDEVEVIVDANDLL